MCDCNHELVDHFTKYCNEQAHMMRQLVNNLRRSIPTYVVHERQWLSSSATQITLLPQSQNLELIQSLIVYTTSAATLVLGPERSIPLPAMTTPLFLTNISIMLNSNDQRILTQATPGAMALELMGIEIPDRGPF